MALPSFTIAGNAWEILNTVVAGELGELPMVGSRFVLTHNIKTGALVFGGRMYPPPEPIYLVPDDDGNLSTVGDPELALANDGGLNVTGIQYHCSWQASGRVIAEFWFDAPADGGVVDLSVVARVPSTTVNYTVLSATWGNLSGKPAVVAAGSTQALARAAISVSSTTEMNAAITAAVNGLLNGAPGALDTLKELADAINDDASFAATITTALAGKQPSSATLTALAALTTTTYGRSFLPLVDAAAARNLTGAAAQSALDTTNTNIATNTANIATNTAAIATKAPSASPAFTGTPTGITKAHVGLGNVDNTSDAAKPVSALQQAALDGKQALDADLTTIAGLTAMTDNVLQSKAGAWSTRTPTQLAADLPAVVGDAGSGGTKGLVPAPAAGDAATKFLKANGTWAVPVGGGGGDALVANPLSQFAATTSAQLRAVIFDETGTGAAVFATSPALVTPTGIVKGDVGLGNVDNTSDATKNVTAATLTNKTMSGASNTFSNISANSVIDGTTNKAFLATERTKLTGVSAGATANSSDATLLARANHTGTQLSTTISDFTEAAQDAVAASLVPGANVAINYDDAANTITIASSGGGGAAPYVTNVGTAAAGPYTITHNLGTRNFTALVRRNAGHSDNIGLTNPGEYIDVLVYPTGLNTAAVDPSETWNVNQFQVILAPLGGDDVTAPAAPVITEGTITSSSVVANVTGSDNVGVTFWEWDLNGTFVARTPVGTPTYTYGGLSGGTAYALGCTAVDLQGNRTRGTRTSTTSAAANVLFDTASTPTSATGSQASWSATNTVTVGSGTNRILLVHIATGHTGGGIDGAGTGFPTKTVVSNNGGALTLLGAVNNDNSILGSTFVYYMLNPPAGAHTITANFVTGGTWYAGFRMVATAYSNVIGINLRATRTGQAAGVLSIAAASAVGGIAGITLGLDIAAPNSFNQTQRVNTTGPGGSSDYLFVGDAPGAASVTFSHIGNQFQGAITYDLVKA